MTNGISKKAHIAGIAITSIVGISGDDKFVAVIAIVAIFVVHSCWQGFLDWRNGRISK